MIIFGIDPGLARTGYGIIKLKNNNELLVVDYGCITTSSKDFFPNRLFIIYKELENLIKKHNPNKVAIERLYFAKNIKTAMKVGEARGVAVLATAKSNCEIFEFTPLQVKQTITGYGQASKSQVQKMVKIILNLQHTPRPDDVADALGIAITCAQTKQYLK